jgi:chromosome segregation ATPase
MNEPLSLEGDIRYLKEHIITKDRQLADAQLRVGIYREAWRDAAAENAELREENKKQHSRIRELEDTLVRLQQDALQRRNENLSMRDVIQQSQQRVKETDERNRNQFQIIQDLRKEKEILIGDRTSLVEEANELYEKLGRIKTIIDEIVD